MNYVVVHDIKTDEFFVTELLTLAYYYDGCISHGAHMTLLNIKTFNDINTAKHYCEEIKRINNLIEDL